MSPSNVALLQVHLEAGQPNPTRRGRGRRHAHQGRTTWARRRAKPSSLRGGCPRSRRDHGQIPRSLPHLHRIAAEFVITGTLHPVSARRQWSRRDPTVFETVQPNSAMHRVLYAQTMMSRDVESIEHSRPVIPLERSLQARCTTVIAVPTGCDRQDAQTHRRTHCAPESQAGHSLLYAAAGWFLAVRIAFGIEAVFLTLPYSTLHTLDYRCVHSQARSILRGAYSTMISPEPQSSPDPSHVAWKRASLLGARMPQPAGATDGKPEALFAVLPETTNKQMAKLISIASETSAGPVSMLQINALFVCTIGLRGFRIGP